MKRAPPNDKPLGEPKQKFEDTFGAETVVLIKYFGHLKLEWLDRKNQSD